MEIRCKKGDCKHNTGCSCSAKTVGIDRTERCASYVRDAIKNNLIIENGNIFKVADELVPQNLKDVPLGCRAKNCLYNVKDQCTANGITVISANKKNKDHTGCATYIKK